MGILKSGAAYVSIDVSYPRERVDCLISDSQCGVILKEELVGLNEVKEKFLKLKIVKIHQPYYLITYLYVI